MRILQLITLIVLTLILIALSTFYVAAQTDITCPHFRATHFADVTGDGRADAIAVDSSGIRVRRSTRQSGGRGFFAPEEIWSTYGYYGQHGTYFADVDGDGRADAITVDSSGIRVRRSGFLPGGQEGFKPPEIGTSDPFYGQRGTYFADVNGDGRADAIVVNSGGITVRPSTFLSFGIGAVLPYTIEEFSRDREEWLYFTSVQRMTLGMPLVSFGYYFADVTGDGKADFILSYPTAITVNRSNGRRFVSEAELWLDGDYHSNRRNGEDEVRFADVNGDSRADAIVVNSGGVVVRLADETVGQFLLSRYWTEIGYFGNVGTYFADVNGDSFADAIVVNTNQITVRNSDGSRSFHPNSHWTVEPYYGDLAMGCTIIGETVW